MTGCGSSLFRGATKVWQSLLKIEVVPKRAAVLELNVVSAVLWHAIAALQVVWSEDQHFLVLVSSVTLY